MDVILIAISIVVLLWLAVIFYRLIKIAKGLKDLAGQFSKYKKEAGSHKT